MPKTKTKKLNLDPHDPRVTAAVVASIKRMSIDELDARLAHRAEGVVERQFPDPTPTTREELLRKQAA